MKFYYLMFELYIEFFFFVLVFFSCGMKMGHLSREKNNNNNRKKKQEKQEDTIKY